MRNRLIGFAGTGLIITLLLGIFPFESKSQQEEVNEQKEALIIKGVLSSLQQLHYEPIVIDDQISQRAFKAYLEKLDASKRFLTQKEYQLLKAWELQIDDEFLNEKFTFFNLSLEVINNAIERAKNIYPVILSKAFDFQEDEYIEMDAKKMDFAQDENDLKDRWRKILKYDALLKLINKLDEQEKEDFSGEKKSFEQLEEEVRSEIKKNMDNWFGRMLQIRRSDRFSDYVNSVVELFDPHTSYFSPKDKEDFNINMSGSLEGIGARLQSDGEYTKVESIVPGGPAWKQKELEVNDQILKVRQENGEAIDIRGMRLDDVVKQIRGKKGTKVTLTVRKKDGSQKDITIVRDEVILDEGFAKSAILDYSEIIDQIGYIRLPKFYVNFENPKGRNCSTDVAQEIEKLKANNVKGIILDLRNNGGGSLRDVVDMSGFFIESGPIVQVKSRNQKPQVLSDQDSNVQYDGPLIVLVNTFSASASEILAAAMQDYNRALIVGSPSTFGKGTVQRFYDLDKVIRSNSELKPFGEIKLTMQKFYRINGGSTQLKGVKPDIILPDNYMFLDLGEKEYDYPMPWSEIEPLKFKQNTYNIHSKDVLINNSKKRVENDSAFQAIVQSAHRLKSQREERNYPLHIDAYRAWLKDREEFSEKLDEIIDREIPNLSVRNLQEDLAYIEMDESRVARNDNWLEGLRKDLYLKETLHLMKEMIEINPKGKLSDKK